jgi:alpha-tubulin suppressor-like RCC1 family protein
MRSLFLPTLGAFVLVVVPACREDVEAPTASDIRLQPAIALTATPVFRQLTAGNEISCGVTESNVAYCWGWNSDGQIGDGTIISRLKPVPVSGGHAFLQVWAGNFHTCGTASSGDGYCWGLNDEGELGDGTTTERHRPVRVLGPI